MIRLFAALVLAGASVNAQTITTTYFGSILGGNLFTINFVTIGDSANVADSAGSPNPVGSVPYVYNLSMYEITRDQINRANASGGLGITMADMTFVGGNGVNRPATGISWNEAARFVNYLNTSRGYQAAYNFTTTGVNDNITLWGAGQYIGSNQYRHKDAYYFLPSVDEWYKAAYGSPSGTWYNYPNGSDFAPIAVSGGTNGAVYNQRVAQGPADYGNAGGLSPYGTMAQGGNVHEWMESAWDGINNSPSENREFRGGAWIDGYSVLSSSDKNFWNPSDENNSSLGFRVASVPEPSSFSLLLAGGAVALARRRKF